MISKGKSQGLSFFARIFYSAYSGGNVMKIRFWHNNTGVDVQTTPKRNINETFAERSAREHDEFLNRCYERRRRFNQELKSMFD